MFQHTSVSYPNFPVRYSSVRLSFGTVKSFSRRTELHQFAKVDEGGVVGYPRCLRYIVGYLNDGDGTLQFDDQFLYGGGRLGIKGRGGLVEKEYLGIHGQGAGDAEPLLLASGEEGALPVKGVLHLVPERALS